MSSFNATGLTGYGKTSIGGSTGVWEIDGEVTLIGAGTHVDGYGTTQRIHQAGWIGLGYDLSPGQPYDEVYWGEFFKYRRQTWRIYPLQIYANTLFWDLQPGVEVTVDLYW